MAAPSDPQRVAGWLALALQQQHGLLDGPRVAYAVTDHGTVDLAWRGGPTALEIAEALLRAADPGMPVTRPADDDLPGSPPGHDLRHACLDVGGVRVLLESTDPGPARPDWTDPIRGAAPYRPPDPMLEDGFASDVVSWEVEPDPGGIGAAIVTRLPVQATDAPDWTANHALVLNLLHQPPPGIHPARLRRWRRALASAAVQFRPALRTWSAEDAGAWLADTVAAAEHVGRRAPVCTAVTWRDGARMRLNAGLTVDARADAQPRVPDLATRIPAVVLGALYRTGLTRNHGPAALAAALPSTLLIRCFGHGFDAEQSRVNLDTTVTAVP
uniref:hypothetical protein n=1 Tax=Amycolatopsis sp. CA-096443 TaxID=3239919 RepID=UPI003F49828F